MENYYKPWTFKTFPTHLTVYVSHKSRPSTLYLITEVNLSNVKVNGRIVSFDNLLKNYSWVYNGNIKTCGTIIKY